MGKVKFKAVYEKKKGDILGFKRILKRSTQGTGNVVTIDINSKLQFQYHPPKLIVCNKDIRGDRIIPFKETVTLLFDGKKLCVDRNIIQSTEIEMEKDVDLVQIWGDDNVIVE